MSIQPEKSDDRSGPYQTAEELFSRPACTHIVSVPSHQDAQLGLHSQHVHLERQTGAFRATYHVGVSNLRTEDYPSLEDLYQRHPRWRDALWQDISAYPDLSYDARYRPLTETIEVWAMPESDAGPDQESYIVYGAAEVVSLSPAYRKLLRPQGTWLIIKHPGRTWRVVSKKLVGKKRGKLGRAFHRFLLKVKIRSPFIGKQPSQIKREPDFLIVYGQPPSNWRDAKQHIL
jgi:hypothetical protein